MRILKFQLIALSAMMLFFVSCRVKKLKSPSNYKFSEVNTDKLDFRLREISGIVWDSKANVFYANNDETGKLFVLDKDNRKIIDEYVFAGEGDYEDVAIYNGNVYVLRSDGMLTRVSKDSSGKVFGIEIGKPSLSGTNDFETLYSDPARKALV